MTLFVSVGLALLLAVAGFTLVIDAYGAFNSPRFDGLNKYKFTALRFMRVVKPYHVNFREYDVLLTGSSRVGRGMACDYYLELDRQCYNAALTRGGIYEAYRFLQQHPETLSEAVVALEFFIFLRPDVVHEEFVEDRLALSASRDFSPGFPKQAVNDFYGLLYSDQTLRSSRSTLRRQDAPYVDNRSDGMLLLDEHGAWRFDPTTLDPARVNLRVNRQVERYDNILVTMKSYHYTYAKNMVEVGQSVERQLQVYRDLLELAYSQDFKLRLFIPPSHASYWMILEYLGLYPEFERWKRRLVNLNEQVAREHGKEATSIFDFSGFNARSTSRPPEKNKPKTLNRAFPDAMHFSRGVGRKMLQDFTGGCDKTLKNPNVTCINSGNISSHLASQRKQLTRYERDNIRYLRARFPAVKKIGGSKAHE